MKVELGRIYDISSGGTPSKKCEDYYNGGKIKWVKTGDLKKKYLYDTDEHITEKGLQNSSAKLYQPDTVLVAMYGATIGATSILKTEACTNQACAAFMKNNRVIPEYLYYFFKSKKEKFIKDGVGGAQPNISAGYLRKIEIDLISTGEQRKIVEKLGKMEKLICSEREKILQFEILIKSRFVEMFGDPMNEENWECASLSEVTNKIGSGATPRGGRESYRKDGITLIRSMNVHDGYFEYKELAHISELQAAQLDNVMVEENDVFINITGASVARSCIVPNEILPARVNQHVAIIRCDEKRLNPVFANNMFLNDSFKKNLLKMGESGGATRQAITKQQLEQLVVIVPPLELQNQFAAFVRQVDKLKFETQKCA